MKKTILLFCCILISYVSFSQNTIHVHIKGFKNNEGTARVGLFNDEESFLYTPQYSETSLINNQEASVTFTDIPDGVYAISVYHDKDNNGKLNLIMGILPSEDTGTSNNPSVKIGPPKWEDAKFEINQGTIKSFEIIMQ